MNLFLEELKYQIKERTYFHYKNLYDRYIVDYFDIDLSVLDSNYLLSKFGEIMEKYSFSLTKTIYSLTTRSLVFAYEKGYMKTQIVFNIKLKSKPQKQVECLTKQEQNILENYILVQEKTYHYGILISLYTGLRLGELLALKWQNVDLKNKILYVKATTSNCTQNHQLIVIESLPKTNSSIREIPLNSILVKILKKLKSPNTYVLSNKFGAKIDYRGYQMSFTRILRKLKIKHYGFHSLRHTFATRLLESGVDIKTISELMGHSSPTITLNRYVHTNLGNKRKAMQKLTKKDDI